MMVEPITVVHGINYEFLPGFCLLLAGQPLRFQLSARDFNGMPPQSPKDVMSSEKQWTKQVSWPFSYQQNSGSTSCCNPDIQIPHSPHHSNNSVICVLLWVGDADSRRSKAYCVRPKIVLQADAWNVNSDVAHSDEHLGWKNGWVAGKSDKKLPLEKGGDDWWWSTSSNNHEDR